MNTFKQKSLYAALAGVSALGVTGAAQAVNVNPDGLGQVLIYPYYTVRATGGNPYASLLTVVNSTASAKAVKVRFIEGKASQEVLDFNLFLSTKDVWTAGIVPVGDGTGGAGVGTFDVSCTVPALPTGAGIQPFVNYAYDGDPVGDDTLDRTNEGYVEIIEMGTILAATSTEKAVTHVNGVPPCTAAGLTDAAVAANLTNPSGGLFGDMTLINVMAGTDYTEDAVALDNFRNISAYNPPGDILPNLTNVQPPTSVVFAQGQVFQTNYSQSIDAVSTLFMHDHVYNDFVLDSGTASGTDWVLTFPTKRFYFDSNGHVNYLFQRNLTTDGACDDVSVVLYDREERTAVPTVGFSPPRPGKTNTLCWEANVLTFNSSQVLGSTNNRNLSTTYANGWADLSFPFVTGSDYHFLEGFTTVTSLSGVTTGGTYTYFGLPVVGFAVQSYTNGTLAGGVLSNYGGNFVHKGTRLITPGAF